MDSPFPGMDPYLEDPAFWSDFHATFIGCWREAIAEALPDRYEARLNETVHLVPLSEEVIQLLYPDVAVSREKKRPKKGQPGPGTAVLEPIVIPHEMVEEVRQTRIEILHRPERTLVAVLEVLSPANKKGEGFMEFCARRLALLKQKIHLVELDLLFAGRRLPLAKPLPVGDYYAFVSRGNKRPDCEVYCWPLRHALPAIPIPLLSPDPDVVVDLQGVFRRAYQRGRYAPSLSYGQALKAPLSEKDRSWAMGQVPRQ